VIAESKSVYLDDAGHPLDKPFLVLGGFLSTETRWIEFEKPWRKVLADRKVPFPFHATDFFRERRNDPKLKHIFQDLIRVISDHVEAGFSVGLDVDAYKEINRIKRLEEIAGSPLAMISRSLRESIDDLRSKVFDRAPLLYFIEKGTYQTGDMNECWSCLDEVQPPIPVGKEHPSAQAADLYAYSAYQSAPFSRDFVSWQHEMLHETFAIKGIHHEDHSITRSNLEETASKKCVRLGTVKIDGQAPFYPAEKVPIPDRAATANINIQFERNKNKQQANRKAKIGIPNDEQGKFRQGDAENPDGIKG
jgi:hypothetical protein